MRQFVFSLLVTGPRLADNGRERALETCSEAVATLDLENTDIYLGYCFVSLHFRCRFLRGHPQRHILYLKSQE